MCTTGVRQQRVLSQRGFELANGLPFVASDVAIHCLLAEHVVAEAQRLQVALGRIRRASDDYAGKLLAIDPHRTQSHSKRQRRRYRDDQKTKPFKVVPMFFGLDPDTHQPVCFTVDLLVPMKNTRPLRKQLRAIPPEQFTRRWAGFATAKLPYQMARSGAKPVFQFAQRTGEKPGDCRFGAFLSTTDRDEVEALTLDYPKRWRVEEFFNAHQALGWKRAGTLNLNIRYGQMTMALIAQAVLHRIRRLLGEPYSTWDAGHFAKSLLAGLEGDIRVHDDTIVVTYYNAPNVPLLREHYAGLPDRLEREHIDPHIPWLYGFKLDFRFR